MSIHNKTIIVGEVMLGIKDFPVVNKDSILKETLEEMDNFGLGVACIIDDKNSLAGIITDGDIRRKLLHIQRPSSAFFIDDTINQAELDPIVVSSSVSLIDAINTMKERQVWDLPVVDNNKLVGLLHLYNAIKKILENNNDKG